MARTKIQEPKLPQIGGFPPSAVGLAARKGEEEVLRNLLTQGALCDVCDNLGRFPIHDAAAAGEAGCLRCLLEYGSKDLLNTQLYNGETPAFLAAENGKVECVKTLLEFGADVNVLNHKDVSLLVAAVSSGSKECVKIFLDCGLSTDGQDIGGWSALHEAASADQRDFISLLLVYGANINIQNADGATPLFTAALYGNQSCLNLLLEKGADINIVTTGKAAPLYIAQEGFINWEHPEGRIDGGATPLHAAAQGGHEDCIQLLLNAGASSCAETHPEKVTPLHLSSLAGRHKCLEVLLKSGAKADTATFSENITPLCLACEGHANCTKLLLEWGANPNHTFVDYDGLLKTPLLVAVEGGRTDCVKILVEHGADINMSTYTSPLILAAKNSYFNCCKILLDFGANINFIDRGKTSALSQAVTRYHNGYPNRAQSHQKQLECIKLLLKRGASVDQLFEEASRPTRSDLFSTQGQRPDLFELLLEFEGNRPDTRDICLTNAIDCRNNRHKNWNKLVRITNSPRSLQHFCRLVIRETVSSNRVQRIPDLPVPSTLKQFLIHAGL